MEKKYYQIGTQTAEDWPIVHKLLMQDGTLEDNIPSRSVECENEILHSPTRSTYLMTDEEAEILRTDPRIKFINLDPGYYKDVFPRPTPDIFRYDRSVRNYRSLKKISNNKTISSLSSPTSAEFYRTGYQILRCAQRDNPWPADASTVLTENVEYNYDGTDVDIIIVDDGVFFGHPEFVYDEYTPPNYIRGNVLSRSGTCGVLDLVLDAPYYLDPAWFDARPSARLERRWDGTLVPKEDVARDWWKDRSERSLSFPNFGSIFISSKYTRAANCGANRTTRPSNKDRGNHGTPCAAQAYGKNHGWAFNANKWAISTRDTYDDLIFDITKIFHRNKPNNPKFGTKNPTVSSNSWSSKDAVSDVAGYWSYQGKPIENMNKENLAVTAIDRVGQPAFSLDQVPFLKTIKIGTDDFQRYQSDSSSLTAGKELIDSGVIFVCAGGNTSRYLASPVDPNFNNYYRESFFSFDSLLSRDQARTSATSSTPVTLYPFANTTINSKFFANNPSDSNLGSDNFTRRFGVTPINLSTSSGSSGSGTYTWSYNVDGIIPEGTYRIKAKADDRANISIYDKKQTLVYTLDFGFGTSGPIRQQDAIFTIPSSARAGTFTITITYTQGGGGSIASGNLSYCAFVITGYGDIIYTNRPGFPAQIGYTDGDPSYKTFVIGAIDDRYTNSPVTFGDPETNSTYLAAGPTKEKLGSGGFVSSAGKDDYSTRGTGIDFYAPGDGTLAASSPLLDDDDAIINTDETFPNPYQIPGVTDIKYYDQNFNGTSSATPTAAGLIACALQNNRNFDALQLKTYLKNNIGNQTNFFTGIAPTSAKDPNWHEVPYNTMGTPVKIIHEITTTSSTPNPSFRPQYGILSSSSVNERFTITHKSSNRNTLNIYGVSTVPGVIAPFSSSITSGTSISLEIRNGYYLVGSNNRVSATASGGPARDSDGTLFGRLDKIAIRVDPTNNKRVQLSDSDGRSWDDMEITVLNGTFQKVGTQIYYVFSGITSPTSPTAPTSTTTSTSGAPSIATAPTITPGTPGAIVSTGGGLSVDKEISAGGNIFAFVSDERLKGNQRCIENALDKVEKLNGFTYNFNETGEKLGFDPDKRHSGVSAQDVQEVLPEAVAPAPADNNYLTVKYDKLIPLLIESIKDLKNDIDNLKDNHNK